ncbi:hypothetical protein BaRGS_00026487 [Batillaria attramentaria]|uniref:Uncharacterized protein n=1 Tax=Batillaria attramentaria TaxID=370345 RepID=A0ABD0K4R4_9CAEN
MRNTFRWGSPPQAACPSPSGSLVCPGDTVLLVSLLHRRERQYRKQCAKSYRPGVESLPVGGEKSTAGTSHKPSGPLSLQSLAADDTGKGRRQFGRDRRTGVSSDLRRLLVGTVFETGSGVPDWMQSTDRDRDRQV